MKLDNGTVLTLLTNGESITILRSVIPQGVVKPAHAHAAAQIYLVEWGRMEITVGEETYLVTAGDTCLVPSNVPHAAVVLEESGELEIFAPGRPELVAQYFGEKG